MNRSLFFLVAATLFLSGCQDYQIKLIGDFSTTDSARKIIQSADGNFLVAGFLHNKAAIYRLNCQGDILNEDLLDFGPSANSYNSFNDLIELPNQNIVAVGVLSDGPKQKKGLMVLLSPGFDVLKIQYLELNSNAIIKNVALLAGNVLAISGETIAPNGQSNIFFCRANTENLALLGPPVLFNFYEEGIGHLYGCSLAPNGDLLLSGASYLGKLSAYDPIVQQSWVSRISPEGKVIWTYSQQQTFATRYGLSYFSAASVNPSTGNLLVTGIRFSGDSLEYQTDPYALLLNAEGEFITDQELPLAGRQNLFDCKSHFLAGNYLAVGDSSGVQLDANYPRPILIEIEEDSLGMLQLSHRTIKTELPGTAYSIGQKTNGLWFGAGELHPEGRRPTDIAVVLPMPSTHITYTPDTLMVRTGIPAAHIAWYLNGVLLQEGPQEWILPAGYGTYEAYVTDPNGCTNYEAMEFLPTAAGETPNQEELDTNWRVLPNPVSDQMSLYGYMPQTSTLSLALFTPEGRQLWRRQVEWLAGTEMITIDLTDCPKGIYYLRVYDKRRIAALKVFKN